jgi:hydroxyacylglutathione hydrolase
MNITIIKNKPIQSNCYVLWFSAGKKCIVIDPGTIDNAQLLKFLNDNNLALDKVILTHEHLDHCAGVNALHREMPFTLVCSKAASTGISCSKSNFSEYFDNIESFEITLPAHVVTEEQTLVLGSEIISFIETPGHSPGSMCILIGQNLFTGDTLLNNTKTPLKLPGSNKKQHSLSLEKLQDYLTPGMSIYPGHDEPYIYISDNNYS